MSTTSATTTTELALPGLEASDVTVQPDPRHFIERGPQKRLMVVSGRSHPDLAGQIALNLGVELGEIDLETFPNGETYCRYKESIRGADLRVAEVREVRDLRALADPRVLQLDEGADLRALSDHAARLGG